MPRPAYPRPRAEPFDGAATVAPATDDIAPLSRPAHRRRVFIADDHPLVLRALRAVIADQDDLTLVGEADTEAALFASEALGAADVLVLDLSLGRGLIERARVTAPDLIVIAYSILPGEHYESAALKAGAAAFVSKGDHPAALLAAIRRNTADSFHPAPV